MNHLFFSAKMFHLGSLRTTRNMLGEFGITPARYDMLIAIVNEPGGVSQADLRAILGVSGPTISRMLASLEELRFVVRTPHPRNARHKWVAVTPSGLYRLKQIIDALIENDLPWITDEVFNPEPEDRDCGDAAIAELDARLWSIRERLGDVATLRYPYDEAYGPWCPLRRARAERLEKMRSHRRDLRAVRRSRGGAMPDPSRLSHRNPHESHPGGGGQRGGNVATPSFQM